MNRLKELRKTRQPKSLTQQELADIIGVTKRTMIAWENEERQIKPDKVQALADFFGVSVGYLLGFGSIEEELAKSHNDFQKQWKEESNVLLNLGFILSDNDIDVISQLLHNMSSRNSEHFFKLVEHNDSFIAEYLESEFSAFFEKNPNFITDTQKEYNDYIRRINRPAEQQKIKERIELIKQFQQKH
ncbi:TPA: helix-turn-helix transcriptional regulator [Streptococcus pyogenes]|nr:helix-turn-helix transcriptional regulator [Streptococcus pyogenes]